MIDGNTVWCIFARNHYKTSCSLIIPIILLYLPINLLACMRAQCDIVFLFSRPDIACAALVEEAVLIFYIKKINDNVFLIMDNILHLSILTSIPQMYLTH